MDIWPPVGKGHFFDCPRIIFPPGWIKEDPVEHGEIVINYPDPKTGEPKEVLFRPVRKRSKKPNAK